MALYGTFRVLDPKRVYLKNTRYNIAVYLKYELISNTYQTNITSVIFLILFLLFIIYFQSTHNIICWQLPQESYIIFIMLFTTCSYTIRRHCPVCLYIDINSRETKTVLCFIVFYKWSDVNICNYTYLVFCLYLVCD